MALYLKTGDGVTRPGVRIPLHPLFLSLLDSDYATDFCSLPEFLDQHGLWTGAAIYNNTSDQALPISMGRTQSSQDLDTIWNAFVNDSRIKGDRFLGWLHGTDSDLLC